MKTAAEIRNDFIEYFRQIDHKIVKSAPVIPMDDPTLLFTNAGMNQFKPIFLNQEEPVHKRVADSQKCIRVSGKHNDLEEVGKDTYHHTFFEMLGNWSFGDYYKKEAIQYAWRLFTDVWKFPKERLWATVYQDDDEAFKTWQAETDIDTNHILRFGKKDNFWEMGDTGPCGPCSEIHYYTGNDPDHQSAEKINAGDAEYIELWNLVFIQYNRDQNGDLHPLPKKHVDTGAGLERIVAALQQKRSNYDTDLFMPIINRIAELTGILYNEKTGVPHRVIADHIRMLTFSIADGGMPSNEGRGYVIRRILRRAARFGRMLNMHKPFIYKVVDTVCEILGDVYPESVERREHIKKVIRYEEQSFGETLDKGLDIYQRVKEKLQKQNKTEITGKNVFKLYDTYGFPVDLTQLMAEEDGFTVDISGFDQEMTKQKERARSAQNFKMNTNDLDKEWIVLSDGDDSEFVGYDQTAVRSILRKYLIHGEQYHLVLDKTPFYAESGGEIGDTGRISNADFTIEVTDTLKINNMIVHIGNLISGQIGKNPEVEATIDVERSDSIRANHTATHLLQAALRKVLGDHVHQSGSLVTAERLRFDLTHYTKVSQQEIEAIEDIVNRKIRENIEVAVQYHDFDEAKKSGAMALFGEKYESIVRVIDVGEFSKELCGGKHVKRTGDIGGFKIISESSVAAGIRRIEATTGQKVCTIFQKYESTLNFALETTGTTITTFPIHLNNLIDENKRLKKEISQLSTTGLKDELDSLIKDSEIVNDVTVFYHQYDAQSLDELKKIADLFREKLELGVALIISVTDGKLLIVVSITDAVIKKYSLNAGKIVKELGLILGGGGGGRPHMATAGGKNIDKIPDAIQTYQKIIEREISR